MTDITIFEKSYTLQNETIFANVKQIAELFNTTPQNVEYHIKQIFGSKELTTESTTKEFLVMGTTGQKYAVKHYNLDMIIALGYRINSTKATKFRIEATKILKEYLTEGQVSKKELSRKELALMIIEVENEKEQLLLENKKQEKILTSIVNLKETYGFREIVKDHIKTSEPILKNYLKQKNWLMYLDGKMKPTAYAKENGFAVVSQELNHTTQIYYPQFKITKKGLEFLLKRKFEIEK